MLATLKRLMGRSPSEPAFIETRLDRLRERPLMPPPPPPPPPSATIPAAMPVAASGIPPAAVPGASPVAVPRGTWDPRPPRVRVVLDDGTVAPLESDDLAARANYLAKSMLPPRPPAPRGDGA